MGSGRRCLGHSINNALNSIQVDDNVIIATNAVVIKNVPNNCNVGGIPARRLSDDSRYFFLRRNEFVF